VPGATRRARPGWPFGLVIAPAIALQMVSQLSLRDIGLLTDIQGIDDARRPDLQR
jgi:hypothetical protein